jgi:putative ABC transport system permease protein
MPVPLALRILLHHPRRLAVSTAGVLLAVVLMFSQVGFRNGTFDSQTQLIRHLDGELVLVNPLTRILYVAEPFPSRRLAQARACPGVKAVHPLYLEGVAGALWKNPADGSTRPVRVLAFDPNGPVLDIPEVRAHAKALETPGTVLFDSRARRYYGRPRAGTATELAGRQVEVVGTFPLGTDILTDGTVLMSDRSLLTFSPRRAAGPRLQTAEVGVVQLEPGADAHAVQEALRQVLPDDVAVLTRQELEERETRYWRDNTAIGYVFGLGMAVALVIGVVICYQVLYTNVTQYLPQLATLKAMGYTDTYLAGLVLQQGLLLAVLGFVPGLAVARALFAVVSALTGLTMVLTSLRVTLLLILTVLMCMAAAAIALRRVLRADPAEVFR